jgi:hypothetical protein
MTVNPKKVGLKLQQLITTVIFIKLATRRCQIKWHLEKYFFIVSISFICVLIYCLSLIGDNDIQHNDIQPYGIWHYGIWHRDIQ